MRICRSMVSGEVKRPTPTTGLVVSDFTKDDIGSWKASLEKRRCGNHCQGPGQIDVPQVRKFGEQGDDLAGLAVMGDPSGPCSSSTAMRSATAQVSLRRLTGDLDHLADQARAVLEGAAIGIAAPVGARREELERQVVWPA